MTNQFVVGGWSRSSQSIDAMMLLPEEAGEVLPVVTSLGDIKPSKEQHLKADVTASEGSSANPEAPHAVPKGGKAPKKSGIRLSALNNDTAVFLQVRSPQPQYPDFITDNQPTQKFPEFTFVAGDVVLKDPKSLLDKQVIYIDQSPQENVARALKAKQLFTDELFPPDYQSLFGSMASTEDGYEERRERMIWRSIFEVYPDGQLFKGGIKPGDMHQGRFGNCYYLCALAALAEHPQRIRDLFLKKTIEKSGIFACSIIFRGRWKTIYLDQYFPLFKDEYLEKDSIGTAMGPPGQLWIPVIEKAYNKLYGSYFLTEGGWTREATHDLTGAHLRYLDLNLPGFNRQQAWKRLKEATENNFLITAESPNGKDTNISKTGIVFGHAYTILGTYVVDYLGKPKRLVKCRNPWGQKEWTMEWGNQDSKWKRISAEDRKRIGYVETPNDGQFFMLYDDLCDWLAKISITEIHDDYSYVYASQPAIKGKGCYFKVTIFKDGEYSFQLNQTSTRLVGWKDYNTATMNIGRIMPNGELDYYRGIESAHQVLYRKHTLPAGEYLVYMEQSFHNEDPFRETTLSIYAQYFCKIEVAPPQPPGEFHRKLFLGRARQVGEPIAEDILDASEVLRSDGFLYSAVVNNSAKKIRINVKAYDNLNARVPKIKGGVQEIQPKSSFILVTRIPDKEWVSKLCGFELIEQ